MEKLLKKLNKLSLPITLIIVSLILGGFYYANQVNKQKSIEKQQQIKLQDDRQQQEVKNTLETLKLKQDECKALSAGVIKKWNNVMGVTFDNDLWKECVVTYTDEKTGEVEISPLRFMKDIK